MTTAEQRVAQHLSALLAEWEDSAGEDKREAVEVALSRLPMETATKEERMPRTDSFNSDSWLAAAVLRRIFPRIPASAYDGATRTERYSCPVCEREWDQIETWDDGEWMFSAEPYGFCRQCTP